MKQWLVQGAEHWLAIESWTLKNLGMRVEEALVWSVVYIKQSMALSCFP
jgi:hypothetical protein